MTLRARAGRAFDRIDAVWSHDSTRRFLAALLLFVFVASLLLIELQARGLLQWSPVRPPDNHFKAVEWVVDLLLLFELVDLVLGLGSSVAGALGKQLQVFALILLRKSFEELKNFPEPINLKELPTAFSFEPAIMPLWNMAADAAGAMAIFAACVVFRRLQLHHRITENRSAQERLVLAKKSIAMALLALIVWFLVHEVVGQLQGDPPFGLYPAIFSAFIFSDIAIVLVSLRYTDQFRVVFRNFGFAVVTVFLRLAITAHPMERAILSVGIAVYVIVLAWLYNVADETVRAQGENVDEL